MEDMVSKHRYEGCMRVGWRRWVVGNPSEREQNEHRA
jgi:hypothetical protein